MSNIYIVDSIYGRGKTKAVINYINSHPNERFIYISKNEEILDRIVFECKKAKFYYCKDVGSEYRITGNVINFKNAIHQNRNILLDSLEFIGINEVDMHLLSRYTLIIDEENSFIKYLDISDYDLDMLLNCECQIGEDGTVKWNNPKYEGRFLYYKKHIEMGFTKLYRFNRRNMLYWIFPKEYIENFKKVFILTQMLDGQIQSYYFELFDIEYQNLYVKDFQFTSNKQPDDINEYKKYIHICHYDKLNYIGNDTISFSYEWFKNSKPSIRRIIINNCISFFRTHTNTTSNEAMWSIYSDLKDTYKITGYSKGFVDNYDKFVNPEKTYSSIAYLMNLYPNIYDIIFFRLNNMKIDDDKYALSELVQLIFRSRLKDKEPINIYIPSKRMRTLLENWLLDE